VQIKTIYSSANGPIKNLQGKPQSERRFLSPEKFPFDCEVIIYGDKIAFFTFNGRPTGILIENHQVSLTLKMLFNNLWESAK
jgi:hypothetical protein